MGKLNQKELEELEGLKEKLFKDATWSLLVNPLYSTMVSRYNYLVMRSIDNLLTLEDK